MFLLLRKRIVGSDMCIVNGEDPFENANQSNSSGVEAVDEVVIKPPKPCIDNVKKSPPKPPRKPPRITTASTTDPSEGNTQSETMTTSQGFTDGFDSNFGDFDNTAAPTAASATADQNNPASSNGFDDAWGDFPTTSESNGAQESDPFASSGNDTFGGFDNW